MQVRSVCVCILNFLSYWYMLHDSRRSVAGSTAVCVLGGMCVCACVTHEQCSGHNRLSLLVCCVHTPSVLLCGSVTHCRIRFFFVEGELTHTCVCQHTHTHVPQRCM